MTTKNFVTQSKRTSSLLFLLLLTSVVTLSILTITNTQNVPPHPRVLENSIFESRLPSNLKNPFYQNDYVKSELTRSSWFGPGERQVSFRESDQVPRREIFIVLKHAGLLPQQRQQR